jgi:hypothetical protein
MDMSMEDRLIIGGLLVAGAVGGITGWETLKTEVAIRRSFAQACYEMGGKYASDETKRNKATVYVCLLPNAKKRVEVR